VDGDLKGGQTDFYLIPVDDGKQTIAIMRFYPKIKSLSVFLGLVFNQLPIEWSVSVAGANSFLRDVRNKAEKKVGYKRPDKPGPINYDNLDTTTMLFLEKYTVGLIRETKDGKALNGLTYVSVDAPPEVVWKVLIDFDHYNNFLDGEYKVKEKRKDEVVIDYTSPSFSALIFNFGGWKMENKYIIEAPHHMYYSTISGLYQGSNGDFQIVPIENGKRSLLFHSVGLNMEKDQSLTTRMVKSGTFPFDTVMCISVAISEANNYKKECEVRAKRTK
jgi:hypothetical protein